MWRNVKKNFILNPKEAWSMVFKLMEGIQRHHKNYLPKNFKSKQGNEAKNEDDNVKMFLVTTSNASSIAKSKVDPSVLDNLCQLQVAHELGNPPTFNELKSAITSMTFDEAPGKSGLTTDMLKSLPQKAIKLYEDLIQKFWTNETIDFESWHITKQINPTSQFGHIGCQEGPSYYDVNMGWSPMRSSLTLSRPLTQYIMTYFARFYSSMPSKNSIKIARLR